MLTFCSTSHAQIFADTCDDLLNWTTVYGSSPNLSNADSSLSTLPYITLNNGIIQAELPYTVTGSWTLRFNASHGDWQRALLANVLNADGTEGYGLCWDSASSTQYNGEGRMSLRKFSPGTAHGWNYGGDIMGDTPQDYWASSGHGALSAPMARIELSWDAISGTLALRVDGDLVSQVTDQTYIQDGRSKRFRRVELRGNTTSFFDNIKFQTTFEDSMDRLSGWTTMSGSAPDLSNADSSLSKVPYLTLGNGLIRADLGTTVTTSWTLRFKASHSDWQRYLYACVVNADGTEGYGVLWDSANSTQYNGEGRISIRKFSSGDPPTLYNGGAILADPPNPVRSGHRSLSAPMALIELSWDAFDNTLYLRVDGMPIASYTDNSYDSFSAVYLKGNTTSMFDDVVLLQDNPPTQSEIDNAIDITSPSFGAIGDGVTDNQTAITNAIAAANSQNKALYIPPGVFKHSSILLLNGASIFGHGYTSVLTGSDPAYSTVRLTGNDVFLKNCRLISSHATERLHTAESTLIHAYEATDFVVTGCYLEGAASAALITANKPSIGGSIYNNWIWDSLADGIHITSGNQNIGIWDNRTRNTGDDMIAVVSYNGPFDACENIWIVGNDVRNQPHGRGITCIGGKSVTIEGNHIKNSKGAGIHIASEASYDTYGVEDISVVDNLIVETSDNQHGGIFIRGRNGYPVDDVMIERNRILDCETTGIRILDYTMNLTVYDNYIYNTAKSGISLSGILKNITISGNELLDIGAYGIRSYNSASGTGSSFIISNNIFTDIHSIGTETYIDVIQIAAGSNWSDVSITDNQYENPSNHSIERFLESHFSNVIFNGNSWPSGVNYYIAP
ncbi:right-handed parallel beta-helix repeat-containing protein [Coraliomargarita algicola]|uniref:Right-handed parallel beta-helix repeat-containing protein n=1 Tax=Coraliomargarita algicola TaxID=3092156 RepID=A0ABZ0RMD2_9BACT|nr:right-handed parallel beta-helix repeat-containing protein [Coraliomargarita sp. J2-16]WPJ97262.1 right-handed parallel beta-helix repeat-containing protein [Coraliomargarita sp. J2-16]